MKNWMLVLLLSVAACGGRSDGVSTQVHATRSLERSHLGAALEKPVTIVLSGPRSNYTIEAAATGFVVTDKTGVDATRTISANTRLQFTDTALAFDSAGVAGQTYRLYQAAFNRQPDLGGLSYWIGRMDQGAGLRELAAAFIGSAEFSALYGANPDAGAFVAKLYDNVLHRPYEQAGYDYWVGVINNGGARTDVLAAFSEGSENVNRTSAAMALGIEFTPPASSFSLLQKRIFATTCIACHGGAGPSAGLALNAQAFKQLINATPTSVAAAEAGFKLVMPGNPDKSLLVHKLLMWDPAHSPRYGSAMPLGGTALTVGQIEFVKRWIAAGAPESGEVADPTLLDDKTPLAYEAFTPPPAPVPGQGFQLTTGLFSIAPTFERELFVYRQLGNSDAVYVSRIETKMRNNSHHLLAHTFSSTTPASIMPAPDLVRDIRNPDNSLNFFNMAPMGYHVFFGGSMTTIGGYTFPQGVALRLPANAAIDLNVHYVNTGATAITGEAFVNLYTMNAAQVQHTATTLNLGNAALYLPAKTRTTATKSFTFGSTTNILMLTSHTHSRGERFVIRIKGGSRNGEIVYDNADWESPQIVTYNPAITLKAGEGLTSEITYNNTTDHLITFGLTSEDEMGIVFGYAY